MADHGLTGTHHLDGSLCTRTAACPWSMAAWTAANAALSQQVSAALAIGYCGCCDRNVETPYHHDNHNPPYDGYDYCQGCYDWGCGDPNDTCSFPTSQPASQPQGGPMSTNPITPEMLREDWIDNPNLSKSDKAVLESLPASALQQALDEASIGYQDVWYNMLDNVRSDATRSLLASVPTADSAPDGTQDECLNCALPITRKGGAWIDDIMGAKGCLSNADNGVHNPKTVLAAYLKALQEGGKKADSKGHTTAGNMPLLLVLTSDGSSREDGSVHYATYLLFNEPISRLGDIATALAGLVGGYIDSAGGISFKTGQSQQVDDLWDDHDLLTAEIANLGFDVYQAKTAFLTAEE